MRKTSVILTIFLLGFILGVVSCCGCIKTTTVNSTFGEKKISLDALKIVNNTTTGNYSYEGTDYYYVYGSIRNNNPIDAVDVEMKSTFYAANGSVLATNKTVYLEPKSIPVNGESQFYFEITKPKEKIVSYKIEVIKAKAEYFL